MNEPPKYLNKLIFVNGKNAYTIELGSNKPSTAETNIKIKDVEIAPTYDLNKTDKANPIIIQNTISRIQVPKKIRINRIGDIVNVDVALKVTNTFEYAGIPNIK